MATQVGASKTIDQILQEFIAFAVANAGFTDEGTVTLGIETLRRMSRITNSLTTYWGFVDNPSPALTTHDKQQAEMRMMRVLPTAANWDTVADGQRLKTRLGFYNFADPMTGYKFYSDGTNVFAAIEVRAGIFTHLAVGDIVNKCGVWNGGAFLQADYHLFISTVFEAITLGGSGGTDGSNYVFAPRRTDAESAATDSRCYLRYFEGTAPNDNTEFFPVGGFPDNLDNPQAGSATISPPYRLNELGEGTAAGTTNPVARFDIWGNIINQSPSATTLRAPIMPVYITRFDAASEKQRIIGSVDNIGAISVANLSPKDIVNTDWDVYPKAQKTGDSVQATISDIWGIAYKAIP